ncbi:uncharacterized protein LOC135101582 [Scylla paramamosain]|uniref:uncharacterized protein LOC135101582 n=1 Tax=Scylla paramamosain TaxID=85552 RepID=UPI00308293D5
MTSNDAKGLETIQNEALRIALGAPKWTKVDNLRSEAQVPPLTQRINTAIANLLIKTAIRGHSDHLHTLLHNHREQGNQGRWFKRAVEALDSSGITWGTLITAAAPTEAQTAPPWETTCITTIINTPRKKKILCAMAELQQEGLHNISDGQGAHTATYFTDGSTDPVTGRSGAEYVCKTDNGRAAVSAITTTASARTTDFSSSTQTELAAIVMALEHASTYHCRNVLIATDSMTAIAAINKQDGENITQTRAIWKTARAIHNAGRSVTLTWIPSHVGISGNEADALVKPAASDATVATVIPRTLNQLRGAVKAHAERQRQQEQHDQGSESVRWFRQVAAGCPPPARHYPSRLCEVVTCRIRLGYPYPWQLGFATSEEETRCRLCGAPEGHSLEHYLRDCARPSHLRKQCPTSSPTLPELAKHFTAILPQILREYPKFCVIK